MEGIQVLLRAKLLEGLTGGQVEPLLAVARRAEYPRGAHVWMEGDKADSLFILTTGQVRVYRLAPSGEEVVVQVYVEGDHFGEFGLFAEEVRMTNAQAMVPSVCLSFAREPVLLFLERTPLVMRRMLRALSLASRTQLDTFTDVAFHEIRARVARKLLELAQQHGEPTGDGIKITIKLSQGTLAGMIAASRTNVNRVLATFIAGGAVRHREGYFTIRRPDDLRRYGKQA
jgi:CRP/FNR family transcriptional regulator, cyclic AMP receptor protein